MKILKQFVLTVTEGGDLVTSYITNGIESKSTYTPFEDDPETALEIFERVRKYHEETF